MDQDDSDNVSVSDDFSQEDDHNTNNDGSNIDLGQQEKSDYIGQKETRGVFRAKMMVYLVLILSCVAASTVTFIFIANQDSNHFENDVSVCRYSFVLFFPSHQRLIMHSFLPFLRSIVFSFTHMLARLCGLQRQSYCSSLMSRKV